MSVVEEQAREESDSVRALELHRDGKIAEAEQLYRSILDRDPNDHNIMHLLGVILSQRDEHEEALKLYDGALKHHSGFAFCYANRGISLSRIGRTQEALDSYFKAVAIKPDYAEAWVNLGTSLQELARFDEAAEAYGIAIEARPDMKEANWNAAVLQLQRGDYEHGWRGYEWRWINAKDQLPKVGVNRPRWLGGPVEGKAILVYVEQGFGDVILLSRYVTMLARRGAHVVYAVYPALRKLLAGVDGVGEIVTNGEQVKGLDYHIPLSSLPLAFKTTVDTVPAPIPYLRADPADVERWRPLVERDRPRRLRVGLAWSGNAAYIDDKRRSMPLQGLLPVLDLDADFFVVQKDIRDSDLALVRSHPNIVDLSKQDDFADGAAIVHHMDLVLTVDTSIGHLAGAMGKPFWSMLTYVPHWLWLMDRTDSPWYPTAQLFRQDDTRVWGPVIERVRDAMLNRINQR